jgi:hypothetical protein
MTINTEKMFYQSSMLSYKQPTASSQANNKPSAQTHVANYLGQHLDAKLTWRNNIQKTTEKQKENYVP